MTRILLADDHPMVLHGLRAVLGAEPDFRIVGEVSDGAAIVPMVAQLAPDVLVLDIMLPGANGMEVTRQLSLTGIRISPYG